MKKVAVFLLWLFLAASTYAKEVVPGILIVKLQEGVKIGEVVSQLDIKPLKSTYRRMSFKRGAEEKEKVYVLKFNEDEDMERLADRVGELSGIIWARKKDDANLCLGNNITQNPSRKL